MTEIITDVNDGGMCPIDVTIAKNIADMLNKKYPGHLWAVQVRSDQGVIYIFNLAFSREYGYTINMKDLDHRYKIVVKAGGEILERYRQARAGVDIELASNVEQDFAGKAIHERD